MTDGNRQQAALGKLEDAVWTCVELGIEPDEIYEWVNDALYGEDGWERDHEQRLKPRPRSRGDHR